MNQKGFATIFGLCLIMVLALCVKGIQESEMNQHYVTNDFQTEIDLQNAAEGGIYAAADRVRQELALDKDYLRSGDFNRSNHQVQVISDKQGDISVYVWAERVLIYPYKINYNIRIGGKYRTDRVGSGKPLKDHEVYTLFSRAEVDSERVGRKFYRHAFAYVEIDDDGNSDTVVHFMDNTKNLDKDLKYKPENPTK